MPENRKLSEIQLVNEVLDIQGKSTENQNTAVNAIADKYDWVGTVEQYQQQQVATLHPEWVCYITDDLTENGNELNLGDYVKKVDYEYDQGNVVHRVDNETIAGEKTFTSNQLVKKSQPLTFYKNSDVDTTSTVSGTKYSGVGIASDNNEELGYFRHAFHTNNNTNYSSAEMVAIDPDPSHTQGVDRVNAIMSLQTNGTTSSACLYTDQATTSSTSSIQVPTMGWVNDPTKSTNVVHRSDDETIAGAKTFTNAIHMGTKDITTPGTTITTFTVPTISTHGNGSSYLEVQSRDDGSNNASWHNVVANVGNQYSVVGAITDGTDCWSFAPTSDKLHSIVTTEGISKSQNGYVKLGNGLIIQWGQTPAINAQGQTVNLPTAFTSTNYAVTATMNFSGGSNHCSCHDFTTTSFKMHVGAGGYTYNFIAIGY